MSLVTRFSLGCLLVMFVTINDPHDIFVSWILLDWSGKFQVCFTQCSHVPWKLISSCCGKLIFSFSNSITRGVFLVCDFRSIVISWRIIAQVTLLWFLFSWMIVRIMNSLLSWFVIWGVVFLRGEISYLGYVNLFGCRHTAMSSCTRIILGKWYMISDKSVISEMSTDIFRS